MAKYMVSYDLVNHRAYQRLTDELKGMGALRMLGSDWCLAREHSGESKSLRDYFMKFIDSDDRLFVSEISNWAGVRMMDTPNSLK